MLHRQVDEMKKGKDIECNPSGAPDVDRTPRSNYGDVIAVRINFDKGRKRTPTKPPSPTPKTIGEHDVRAQTASREKHHHRPVQAPATAYFGNCIYLIVYHSMASRCIPGRGHEHLFSTKIQLFPCIYFTYLITSGCSP